MRDRPTDPSDAAAPRPPAFDAVIVGAGFAGLYMLHRLRGLGLSTCVLEAGAGVGGTWYWNRYPGARCDVESMQYSYSFDSALEQEWRWSERYAAQPEILAYADHVADRLDLRRDIRLNTRVTAAEFDEAARRWTVHAQGEAGEEALHAHFVVMATGCLSTARLPDIPGRDSFAGPTFHTGHWPHEGADFTGQRVGVIGTGSSAIQSIPVIARQAAHLTVFQRTPNFSVPAWNGPLAPEEEQAWKSDYPARRERARGMRTAILYDLNDRSALSVAEAERRREYEARWARGGLAFMAAFNDLILDRDANDTASAFVRERVRATVRDPATAAALMPTHYPIGTKRLCVDTGYYETFNRENVTLIDLRADPIEAITPTGIRTRGGEHALDAIVFATGFDAMTGSLLRVDVRGRGGRRLAEEWAEGPRAYLGLMMAGFPNLFTVTGPGSPSVLTNMIQAIEQHVDWIADCLAHLRTAGAGTIEPTEAAQEEWTAQVAAAAARTLYPQAASWYMGANIPGKPRGFMPYIGGFPIYRRLCAEVAAEGYRGFRLSPDRSVAARADPVDAAAGSGGGGAG